MHCSLCSNGARKSYGFVTLETESALQRTVGCPWLASCENSQTDAMAPSPLAAGMTDLHAVQLAAGSEHIINGRTVRINLAGPRPDQMQQQLGLLQNDFLPQLQGMAWAGQQPQALSAQQGAAWPAEPNACEPRYVCPSHHSIFRR